MNAAKYLSNKAFSRAKFFDARSFGHFMKISSLKIEKVFSDKVVGFSKKLELLIDLNSSQLRNKIIEINKINKRGD